MKSQKNLYNNAKKMSARMTAPEKKFAKLLKELGIKFQKQRVVGNKIYDFYIERNNMLVEIDGSYYHSDPRLVIESDMNKMQIRNKKNDAYKDLLAVGLGYKIERIWEIDLNYGYLGVKERIIKLLS